MDDLKAQLRRDLSVQKLFNKEITSHINISDKDIADFYNTNRRQLQPGRAADPHGADPGDVGARIPKSTT